MATDKRWSSHGAMMVGAATVALLFGTFGVWGSFARLGAAVIAPGQVQVEAHRQVVQHPEGGVVARIDVKEGQLVSPGEILLRLDGTHVEAELAAVSGQYFEMLARQARLEAERSDAETVRIPDELTMAAAGSPEIRSMIESQERLFRERHESLLKALAHLDQQAVQAEREVEGLAETASALDTQREIVRRELADQQTLLAKGLAVLPRVHSLEREEASLGGSLGQSMAARAQTQARIATIRHERDVLVAKRHEEAETELRDLGYRLLDLVGRRRQLSEQASRLEVRAPVSGIVHELQVTTPRAVIRPADPILHLVPQDRDLVVAAHVSPTDIDEVGIGQPVRLRFSSFSSRTIPDLHGTISQVSADAITDPTRGFSYYKAEVVLDEGEQEKLGEFALLPGMPAEVFIKTGERTPIAYLMKPLAIYFSRALREN